MCVLLSMFGTDNVVASFGRFAGNANGEKQAGKDVAARFSARLIRCENLFPEIKNQNPFRSIRSTR